MKNNKTSITPTPFIKFSLILLSLLLILFSFTACDDDPNGTPTYGVSISQTTLHTFTAQTVGYGAQTPFTVTVTNTGSEPTGDLTIELSGDNLGDFTLSKTSIDSIAVGGNDTFTVAPKPDLEAKTYTATVTVSGENITSVNFGVSFTVNPPNVEYWNITWHLNSGAWGGDEPSDQIEKGETLIKPTDPIRSDSSENGINFLGWYTDKNLTVEYTFDTPVTEDLTLYAKWPPMFWWGNYIPDGDFWPALGDIGPFNLQELIDSRHINRIVCDQPPEWEQPVVQENKFWEIAEKEDKPLNIQVLGFPYFITPQDFGLARILNAIGADATGIFTRHERNIDGIDYYIYQHTNPQTAPGTTLFTLQFPN